MTLADLAMGDGRRLHAPAVLCRRKDTERPSKWEWPKEMLCNADTLCWYKGLCHLTSEGQVIPHWQHLGPWITTPHKQWDWFFHPPTCSLIRYSHGAWQWYEAAQALQATRRPPFRRVEVLHNPPQDLLKATVTVAPGGVAMMDGYAADLSLEPRSLSLYET